MEENKDTFKKSMNKIDKSIEKIVALNKYLLGLEKKKP
jgi:hypothetical protein